jgi:hypothetical protein
VAVFKLTQVARDAAAPASPSSWRQSTDSNPARNGR